MDIIIQYPSRKTTFLSVSPGFKPGDPPPLGYNDWHEWAEVQSKAGLKQRTCGRCSKWKFPQELSDTIDTMPAQRSNGKKIIVKSPVCKECDQ